MLTGAEVNTSILQSGEGLFRNAAFERNHHRAVLLVAMAINGEHDLVEPGIDPVGDASLQLRVLKGDVGRQERFRNASAVVHSVQAEVPAQVAYEIDALAPQLW